MGWSAGDGREIFSAEEIAEAFRWEQVGKGAPVFDLAKLEWLNGEYIRRLSPEALADRLRQAVPLAREIGDDRLRRTLPLVQERLKRLSDYPALVGFLFADRVRPDPAELVAKKATPAETAQALRRAIERLESLADWTAPALEAICRALAEELGWKAGQLFMPMRVAVTGTRVSPPLFESMEILGRERALDRLRTATALLREPDAPSAG